MDAEKFRTLLQMAGGSVTIFRPGTGDGFTVTMGCPGTVRDETLFLESKQNDEQAVFSRLDFDGKPFSIPQPGDRISDVDGDDFSIEQVKKMYGLRREIYGWKCRIRG